MVGEGGDSLAATPKPLVTAFPWGSEGMLYTRSPGLCEPGALHL